MAFQNPGGGEIIMDMLAKYLRMNGVHVDFFNQFQTKIVNYDLIHHFSLLDPMLAKNYQYFGKKYVLTPTAWPRESAFDIKKYHLKRFIKSLLGMSSFDDKALLENASYLLPTTDIEMFRLQNFYKLHNVKTKVIPNAVEMPFHGQIAEQLETNLDVTSKMPEKYMLFIGNITKVKNLHLLMDIANEEKIHLVIIGDKKIGEEEYFNFCLSKISEFTHFLGRVENGSNLFNQIIMKASLVVIPSEFETCSLVGLEAGIRGKKVLITQNGGTKSVYRDKVVYIDPHNPQQLKAKILEEFKNPQDFNRDLKNFIEENYTWDKIAKEVIEVYKTVLSQ